MPTVTLPELYCPFEPAVSPLAEDIDRHTLEWAASFGIIDGDAEAERFARSRVGWLAARTSPRATRDGLRLLADWQMWLFNFDDQHCDESEEGARPHELGRLVARYLRILDSAAAAAAPAAGPGEEEAADPLAAALADVRDRLRDQAEPHQIVRFTSAVTGYFLALLWEAANRAAEAPADLADYQLMRRHSGAVPTCAALADVACGFELSPADYAHPRVRALTDRAVNAASWANDVLSYPKEVARSRAVHSLPAVLARQHGLSPQEALDRAAALHDDEVRRFLREEEELRAGASAELHRYLDDLRWWMRGNLDWSRETARYSEP